MAGKLRILGNASADLDSETFCGRDEGFRFCGCDWRGMVLRVRLRDGTTASLGGGVSEGLRDEVR
jgi:hypothetical protein